MSGWVKCNQYLEQPTRSDRVVPLTWTTWDKCHVVCRVDAMETWLTECLTRSPVTRIQIVLQHPTRQSRTRKLQPCLTQYHRAGYCGCTMENPRGHQQFVAVWKRLVNREERGLPRNPANDTEVGMQQTWLRTAVFRAILDVG